METDSHDEIADFNKRCGQLNPHESAGWDAACRRISPQFLVDLLINSRFRDQVQQHGVRLRGVDIVGKIDLADAEIKPQLLIELSRIEGDAILTDSHWARPLSVEGSTVTGNFFADGMRTDSVVLLGDHALFEGEVDLPDANVGSNLDMDNSTFAKMVNGDSLTVDGSLFMGDATFRGDAILRAAKVGSNLEMDRSTFAKTVDGDRLTVDGYLFMRDHATFSEDVILRAAKVGSNLEMDNSTFAKTVDGYRLTVDGSLFMRSGAGFKGEVDLTEAKVGSLLDLREAKAWTIDLSGAKAGEIQTGGLEWWCADGKPLIGVSGVRLPLAKPGWQSARCEGSDVASLPKFILRNFQVGAFQDSKDAWPPALDIEGFRYDSLGSFGSVASTDTLRRTSNEWTDWLARDSDFSNQPYTQLSSVLTVAGYRDRAADVQIAGRERERQEACKRGSEQLGTCAWLTTLSFVAGYGIGLHTFRVLWWIIFLTVLGAVVLCFSRKGRAHGIVWRIGASLHRLLPIVVLSREFEDFFDNRSTDLDSTLNLNRFQVGYFAVHAIAGWALGLILLAAMSGLTQKG